MEKYFRIPIKTQILIVEEVLKELKVSRAYHGYPIMLCGAFKRRFRFLELKEVPFYFVIRFATIQLAKKHGAKTDEYLWWDRWNKSDRIAYLEQVLSRLKAYKRYGIFWRLFY